MSQDTEAKITEAWTLQRKGDNEGSARLFEQVLAVRPEDVDAHYGLALAKRASGEYQTATASLQKALTISEERLEELRGKTVDNDLATNRDDRYLMLIRMIKQRIVEVEALK